MHHSRPRKVRASLPLNLFQSSFSMWQSDVRKVKISRMIVSDSLVAFSFLRPCRHTRPRRPIHKPVPIGRNTLIHTMSPVFAEAVASNDSVRLQHPICVLRSALAFGSRRTPQPMDISWCTAHAVPYAPDTVITEFPALRAIHAQMRIAVGARTIAQRSAT